MALAGRQQISDQDIRSTATAQGGEYLGQEAQTSDGRKFRYGANASTSLDLAAGKLAQGAVVAGNHVNRTGTTQAVGDSTVTFAVGNTLVSADQYRGGYLVVNAGTGAGQTLLIRGNTAAAASGSPTIYLKDFVETVTAVSDSKFSLHPHPYSACLIFASGTLAAPAVGVPNVLIAKATTALPATYGWFQTGGVCSVLSDAGAAGAGSPVTYSDDTDGAVGPYETDAVGAVLGYTIILGVSAEYRPVYLTIN